MNKGYLFLGGVIVGALAGATLGILYAPKSGKETRDQLKNKLMDMEHELENIRNKAKEKGLELKDEIKNKVADLEKKIEHLINEYRHADKSA
ncbi:MAG: YtxH domain-containing protein [Marinilabiliaceae bacterium]|nr:YtxH domain-containing protein [Marinilabiliaceae bacterium]